VLVIRLVCRWVIIVFMILWIGVVVWSFFWRNVCLLFVFFFCIYVFFMLWSVVLLEFWVVGLCFFWCSFCCEWMEVGALTGGVDGGGGEEGLGGGMDVGGSGWGGFVAVFCVVWVRVLGGWGLFGCFWLFVMGFGGVLRGGCVVGCVLFELYF